MSSGAVYRGGPSAVWLVVLAVVVAATLTMAFVHESGAAYAAASVVALIVALSSARRLKRFYAPFFRRWRDLSPVARDRERDVHRSRRFGRGVAILALLVSMSLVPASLYLALRAEVIRGSDLSAPGAVFVAYNRVAAPEIADLIDLFVVRGLPLASADSADLRLLRNLYVAVEGSRFTAHDLREAFEPLIWYRPYRAFPNDVDALPVEYREPVRSIMEIEASRRQ